MIGVAVDGRVLGQGAGGAELVHRHHEAEAAARAQHAGDRADRALDVAHVLQHRERVGQVERARPEQRVHLFGQALAEGHVRVAVELAGDRHVGGGDLHALHGRGRIAGGDGHGHRALAAAGVQHAGGIHGGDLALQLLELGIAPAALHHLARLASERHADALLEQLEPGAPAQAAVLRLLGADVGVAAVQMREP